MGDHRLSRATAPDGLDKAFVSAKKALSIAGIDISVKKPDAAKVSAKMAKTGEPADFMLSCSGSKVFVCVACDGTEVAELGQMSLDLAKRGQQALAELDALVSLKLMSKAEADKLRAGARTGPDPKVAANELRKQTAELNKQITEVKKSMAAEMKISSFDDAERNTAFFAGLTSFCKKEHSEEGLDFIEAVEKRIARDKIMARFIGKKAKDQVNISSASEEALLAGGSFDDAVKEVKGLIARDTMKRYLTEVEKRYEAEIKALETELKGLG